MKKFASKLLGITLTVVMLATTALAAETVTISDWYSSTPCFTVSNVTSSDGDTYLYNYQGLLTTYVVSGSTEITIVGGSYATFNLMAIGSQDGVYTVYETDSYTASGSVYDYATDAAYDLSSQPEYGYFEYTSGCKLTITEPGAYYFSACEEAVAEGYEFVIELADASGEVPCAVLPTLAKTCTPTSATVLVDGEEVAFDAYEIEGNNYFKLRDIAMVLNGTDAQFGVTYNEDTQTITTVSGQSYTAVGGELTPGDGEVKSAFPSSDYLSTARATYDEDGNETISYSYSSYMAPVAYNINNNNYYQLRGLGQQLGFNVTWDEANQTIVVDSTSDYIG